MKSDTPANHTPASDDGVASPSPATAPGASGSGGRGAGDERSFLEESQAPRQGLAAEFIDFLAENKKWWLLPILVVLCLFALLAVFAASGAAPFIYTLF